MARLTRAETQRRAEERLSEAHRQSERFADLEIELRCEATDELIIRAGGRWDSDERCYVGEAQDVSRVMTLHPGQLRASRWFAWWMEKKWALGSQRSLAEKVYDLMLAGGRRGGKSDLGHDLIVVLGVAHPGAQCWIVVPTDGYTSEPARYLESIMHPSWYRRVEDRGVITYELINGSQIHIRSGMKPRKLKQGKADYILINEGQAVPTQSYATLSASIIDSGGIIITAANPPDVGDPGDWVGDLASSALRGSNPHARFFFFDPFDNPHVDHDALRALAFKTSKRTMDIQIRGMFLLPPDAVLYDWSQTENEMPAPQVGSRDITRAFTRHHAGREYDDIIGVDVQAFPWIVGVRFRVFDNPKYPGSFDHALLYGIGEVFLEQGDEIDFAKALRRMPGIRPDRTLVICDATARWQQAVRNRDEQRPEWKGKGAWDMISAGGFTWIEGPDPLLKTNPDVIDRWKAGNARVCNDEGDRFIFIDPEACPLTVESIRKWKIKGGRPSNRSRTAHAGDAVTYVIWRFFPRRDEPTNVGHIPLPPRFGASDRVKGYR